MDLSATTDGHADPATSRREARRRAFMDAAAELFLTKGYAATSLADVVKRSGGSLSTLYAMFESKDGLFRALIEDRCRQVMQGMVALGRHPDLRATLVGIGERLYGLVLSADAIGVFRLLAAEGRQSPEAADAFFETGPDATKTMLAQLLADEASRGGLALADPVVAAQQFCWLVMGDHHMREVCGKDARLEGVARLAHVERSVDLFLAAHAPRR
jgi:AcrR family transcriptional regulator